MEIEYMYNIFGEEAKITVRTNGTCWVELENGNCRPFVDFEKATEKLEKMGYRF